MILPDRQADFLKRIIEIYTETAEPIGSTFLIAREDLPVSGATVRNDMRELEEAGYLTHPHTSAGRIPTEAGYRYYVERLMGERVPRKRDIDRLRKLRDLHALGRCIADSTGTAVIIATGRNSVYYTGISNLFSQPEFRDIAYAIAVSRMFDRCEEFVADLFAIAGERPVRVLIGHDNPFGAECSMFVAELPRGNVMAFMGPLRTDYARMMGLLHGMADVW